MMYTDTGLYTVSSDKVKTIAVMSGLDKAIKFAEERGERYPNRTYLVHDFRGRLVHVVQAA